MTGHLMVFMALEKLLVNYAKTLDTVDCFTGPFGALCRHTHDPTLSTLGLVVNMAELALLKIPFTALYLSRTGDVTSLFYWAPKELFANLTVPGGFLDVIPAYAMRTQYILQKNS